MLLMLLGSYSCVYPYKMNVLRVELMKPSELIKNPDTIDTIALFTRDIGRMDTCVYQYYLQNQLLTDSSIHYRPIYNSCIDALAEKLEKDGHFVKVINYRDSLNNLISGNDSLITYAQLHKSLGVDAMVFLEVCRLTDTQYTKNTLFTYDIKTQFREFAKSDSLANIWANLYWTIRIKGDPNRKVFKLHDDLYYGNSVYPELFGNKENHQRMLENVVIYLGKTMGEKLLPSWCQVDRYYYISRTREMRRAAKCCKQGEWLKAAEIYNKNTRHKNPNITAQAKYNMALMCEMEGELDAATDWLKQSDQTALVTNISYKTSCDLYLEELKLRKKEIEIFDKLVWKNQLPVNSRSNPENKN